MTTTRHEPVEKRNGVDAIAVARALIGDDPRSQRVTWRVQRGGWCLLAAFIGMAVSGLLGGGGPLAGRTVRGGHDGFAVAHERVVRQSRPTTWSVVLPGGARTLVLRDPAREWFERRVVVPRPVVEHWSDGAVVLEFHRTSAVPLRVQLVLVPTMQGIHKVDLESGGAVATLSILTLP